MTTVEFGSKDAADAVREEYSDHLCSDDDRRLKTVTFSSDTPEHVLEDARRQAVQSRAADESGPGQVALTAHERDRIDFSKERANVPHARSVKGIARAEGVDDWTAYYDPTLTVDEHREVMARAARDERGSRRDAEESDTERAARLTRQAEASECDHARGHCEHGDPEACEFLQDRCGYDDETVQRLLSDVPADTPEEITGPEAGALKRAWRGYKAASVRLNESLADAREAWRDAQQAARAINGIRAAHGQDGLHFDNLEAGHQTLSDLAREAAADCHECHGLDVVPRDQQATDDDVADAVDGNDRNVIDTGPAQQGLGGEPTQQDQQATFADAPADPTGERRHEAERNQGGLAADTRTDPSRGADSDAPETEQRQFRDPDQETL